MDSSIQGHPETSHLKTEQTVISSSTKPHLNLDVSLIPVVQKNITFRGMLRNDKKYVPNSNGKIVCTMDPIEIDITRVNDDYCDCPTDGMDEPGTNACQNGRFFCDYQPETKIRK